MKTLPNIFISYNPDSEFEETLAIRLHTIGAVHGFQMYLPERIGHSSQISQETQNRINLANYFILFSTKPVSKTVLNEIQYAFSRFKDKSRILIIYDKAKGKNLSNTEYCTEFFIDSTKQAKEDILDQIFAELNRTRMSISATSASKGNNDNVLAGILLAGLGLLLLGALLSSSKE
jgi:hypothetical protein